MRYLIIALFIHNYDFTTVVNFPIHFLIWSLFHKFLPFSPFGEHYSLHNNNMRIKLNSRPQAAADINNLWRNSPCSMNYILSNTATDRSNRFQLGSIYHRDQVDKPKKIFN